MFVLGLLVFQDMCYNTLTIGDRWTVLRSFDASV